jgi:hypothetical protein
MKRKFVTAVLVLAMIMSMGTIAMAEEPTEPTETKPTPATTDKGDAGIAYEKGKIEITDPDDPLIPDEEDDDDDEKEGPWSFVTDRDIDFGKHDVLTNVQEHRFASWLESRSADKEYVGLVVRNGTVTKYQVVVGIDPFYATSEQAPNGKIQTLQGFELELVTPDFLANERDEDGNLVNITNPYNRTVTKAEKAGANSSHLNFKAEDNYRGGKINAGNNGADPVTKHVFDIVGLGIHAASWGGVLTVPPSSVTEIGEAQAVMTWNIMNVPAPNPIVP